MGKIEKKCIRATGAINFTPVETSAQSRPRSRSNLVVETGRDCVISKIVAILANIIPSDSAASR